jgi:hypothetical protein
LTLVSRSCAADAVESGAPITMRLIFVYPREKDPRAAIASSVATR